MPWRPLKWLFSRPALARPLAGPTRQSAVDSRPERVTPASPKRLVPKVLLPLLVVCLIEIGLRLAGFGPETAPQIQARYDKFQPDGDLGWVLKPSWSGSELNGAEVRTNSLGLRGPEPVSPADTRILFLGDSVVFGHFLEDQGTIPRILEAMLRETGDRRVEVVNAGVPGYSTFQEETYYRTRGRRLKPTHVLLGFCLNDVTERYTNNAAWGGTRFFMHSVDTSAGLRPARRLWQATAMRDALVKALRSSAKRVEAYRVSRLWTDPDAPHIRRAWETVFEELDGLASEVEGDGAFFSVVIFPVSRQLGSNSRTRLPRDRLVSHLKERGIRHLDLLEPLLARGAKREEIFRDTTHFTAPGARIVACEIRRYLASVGL